jgi:hypothetical protein
LTPTSDASADAKGRRVRRGGQSSRYDTGREGRVDGKGEWIEGRGGSVSHPREARWVDGCDGALD